MNRPGQVIEQGCSSAIRSQIRETKRAGLSSAEIVGVRLQLQHRLAWRDEVKGDAVALGIGLGRLDAREIQPNLLLRLGTAGPAGKRVRPLPARGFELEHPFPR